jgi:hypothetical protein
VENNFGGSIKIIEQLKKDGGSPVAESSKNSSDFQDFYNLVENLAVTVVKIGRYATFASKMVIKELLKKLPDIF